MYYNEAHMSSIHRSLVRPVVGCGGVMLVVPFAGTHTALRLGQRLLSTDSCLLWSLIGFHVNFQSVVRKNSGEGLCRLLGHI